MKKRIIYIIFLLCFMFFGTKEINAEYCSTEELVRLNTLASNVKVTYEANEEINDSDPNPESHYTEFVLDMKVYNVSSDLSINLTSQNSNKSYTLDYTNVGADGAITVRVNDTSEIDTYYYTITPTGVECYDKTLRVISLTLPKYNYASKKAICDDVPEYYLCQQYVMFNIDYSTFTTDVEKYKARLDAQKTNGDEINLGDNNNVVSKTFSSISKYKYFIVIGIIAIGVVVTVVVLNKKGSALK